MDVRETVAERLKQIRKRRGLSQQAVAKNIQVTQAYVALIEKNKREPGLDILLRYAVFFKVSMNYIFGLTDTEFGDSDREEFESAANDQARKIRSTHEILVSGEEIEELIRLEVTKQLSAKKKK